MKGFKNSTKMVCEPVEMATGGIVDRNMIESTSARPRRVPLREEVPTAAERGAIQRGNRAAALEASESAVMSPRVRRSVPVAPREPVIRKAAGGLAVKPVKKSMGGIMEGALGYLTGGVPGLFGALTAQRLRKEQAAAAGVPITAAKPSDPTKPVDPMNKDPQQLKRGGPVRKGVPVASRAPMYGRK